MIKTITKDNFKQEVENAPDAVVVELWAPWCIYCRRLSPVLDNLDDKLNHRIVIGKINVDEQPDLAEQLDASTIPTLYIFKNGKHGEKCVAPETLEQVETFLKDGGVIMDG